MTETYQSIAISFGSLIFGAGFAVGHFREKRKRDKEMAGFVAERLMRKSAVSTGPMQGGVTAAANKAMAQSANSMGSMLSGIGQSLGSSLLGGTHGPDVGERKVP